VSWTEVKPPALLELPTIELDERELLNEKRMEEDNAMEDDDRIDDEDERIDDEDERTDEESTDEESTDEESTDETLDLLVDADELIPPQIAPVTMGVSIAPLALT